MNKPKNLLNVYNLYVEHIQATHDSNRAKNILNETRSAIMRPLLVGLGYREMIGSSKLSRAEVNLAKEFMKTQPLEKLKEARQAQQRGFEFLQRSLKSQNVYGARLNQLLAWCQNQDWWPGRPIVDLEQRCPTELRRKGLRKDEKLTDRSGKYSNYTLPIKKTSPSLQAELEQFYRFLTEPEYPGRLTEPVTKYTAKQYLKVIQLILGWFYQYQEILPEQLSLTLLIPKLTKNELNNLSGQEKQKFWKRYQREIETWLCHYFKFLRENTSSKSPRTKISRLGVLSALGKFIYHEEVEELGDYAEIPVLKIIGKYIHSTNLEVQEWKRQKRYVANQDKKWPDPIPGKTVLTTVREQVLEPLRKECRIRNKTGKPRYGNGLVKALQRYLTWSFLTDMPARRQEEYRSLKIVLTCPIHRPKQVPPNGLYHPLPPDRKRSKRYDGSIEDNYLYKTYLHKDKFYKDGIWVLDIQAHKNWKIYGSQSIVVPNPKFDDGTCLYDYIERYLYGCWMPGGRKNQMIYDWWQPELHGCRGQWVISGRAKFNPADYCCIQENLEEEIWSWGYFFVQSIVGLPLNGSEFGALVTIPARRLTGKFISPHTMRYIWATWAYQLRLSDQIKQSLAYAMGHKLETLKKMYERCTPEEKRRPIEEAIDKLVFDEIMPENTSTVSTIDRAELTRQLQQLTPEQRQSLLKMLHNSN